MRKINHLATIAGGIALAGALFTAASVAQAQGISNRPIRILLAQTPGTTPDLIARSLAPRLQARWNQPVVVENRAGAAGAIGMEALAKAEPDGHTVNVNVSSTVTIPIFFKVPFDVLTSFQPITMIGSNIFALSVHPSVPAKDSREFIAWVKQQGGNVNYGSPGNGTYHHLMMEQFKLATSMEMTHIPYKGSAPAFTDLIGGQISVMFLPMGVAQNMAKSGKIRILAGSGKERSALSPDIASLHEQGVANFHAAVSYAFWGPAGMSADLVRRYNTVIREILAEPEVRDALGKQGLMVRTSTPEELAAINKAEYEALANVIKKANIKGD